MKCPKTTQFLAVASLALLTVAPGATAQEQPRAGGVLKAGLIGEAPTLDLHATTAVITQQITWHMYETLYTYDKNLNPIPMLAEGHVVADAGRRYTITLRKGVRFHTSSSTSRSPRARSSSRSARPTMAGPSTRRKS